MKNNELSIISSIMYTTSLNIYFPSLWGTTLNGCHLHEIVDTIATYFSNDIKTRVGISINDVAIFRFE